METHTCTKCVTPKPLTDFRFRRGKPISQCKDCTKAAAKEWRNRPEIRAKRRAYSKQYEHTEHGKAARQRSVVKLKESGWMYEHGVKKHMLRNYGLTEFQYKQLLWKQDGRCAICNIEPDPYAKHKRGLSIDHDHETGAVRGLLCGNCNSALGHFQDSIDNLASAIQYLARAKAKEAGQGAQAAAMFA